MAEPEKIEAAVQRAFRETGDLDDGDLVTDFILIAVVQNFETGEEGVLATDSRLLAGGNGLAMYKAVGMMSVATEMLEMGGFSGNEEEYS